LAGLLTGVRSFWDRQATARELLILYITALGIGSFAYYQGRSHDINLMFCLKYPVLLLVLFMDDAWVAFCSLGKKKKYLPHSIAFLVISLFVLSQGGISFLSSLPGLWKDVEEDLILRPALPPSDLVKNTGFVKMNTHPGESVLIVADHQGVYHAETKTGSPFPLGQMDMFFRSEMDALMETIQTQPLKIFWEPKSYVTPFYRVNINQFLEQCLQEKRYIVRKSNGSMYLLEPAGKATP
jgi:hypothetical protein